MNAQVIAVGGIALVIAGLFWIVFTLPASSAIEAFGGVSSFAADAQGTVTFITLFIGAMPIIVGLFIIAWSYTRTIEERETGVSSL